MHKQMANYRGVKLNKATCQQMTAEIMQTYDLYKFAIEQSNSSTLLKKFLPIRQHEDKVLFRNTSEETKWSIGQTENDKCTNVRNVWPGCRHCFRENFQCPA